MMERKMRVVALVVLVWCAGFSLCIAQISEDQDYPDVDVLLLNKKFEEIASKGLIEKWSLSKQGDILTVELTDQWDLMTNRAKAELARRLLSLFGYYIANREVRNWNFSVVFEKAGTRLAEDRGVWWREGKNPKLYP